AEGTDIDVDETQGYYNQEEELYVIGIVPKDEDEEDEIYSFVFDYYQGGTDIYVDDISQLEEEDETGVLCLGDDQYVQYEVYDEYVEEEDQEKVGKVVDEQVYNGIILEVDGTLNLEGEYYYEVYDVVIYGIDYIGD
ncbi:MAG: hypothetical protein EZS28_044454, partial [Streblomastix strix]